jgi:Protein of unknown function (DUF2568)
MNLLKIANLAVAFFLDVAVLGSVGWAATTVRATIAIRVLCAAAIVILFVGLWAAFGAPDAHMHLNGRLRTVFELSWFGAGIAALLLKGRTGWAGVLGGAFVVNAVLTRLWHQQ